MCDDLQASYWSASWYYEPTAVTTIVTTEPYNYTEYYSTSTWSCVSTCAETAPYGGKICYADSLTVLTTSSSAHVGVITTTIRESEDYPGPSPTCSVAVADCASLWTSYSSASKEWSSASKITPPPAGITSPVKPFCDTCVARPCTMQRAKVDLYFWPVAANATSRDMCAINPVQTATPSVPDFPNSTWTEVTTGPYAVVGQNTFYSGNVYLSFASIEATWPCRSSEVRTNEILTLASSDIFTYRGYPIDKVPRQVRHCSIKSETITKLSC